MTPSALGNQVTWALVADGHIGAVRNRVNGALRNVLLHIELRTRSAAQVRSVLIFWKLPVRVGKVPGMGNYGQRGEGETPRRLSLGDNDNCTENGTSKAGFFAAENRH